MHNVKQPISLSELQGVPEPVVTEPTVVVPAVVETVEPPVIPSLGPTGPTGPVETYVATNGAPVAAGLQEVKIEDIKPFAQAPNLQIDALDGLFGELDLAMERTKAELTPIIEAGKEKAIEIQLDSDTESENAKLDADETEQPVKKENASLDDIPDVNPFSFIDNDELDEDLNDIDLEEEKNEKEENAKKLEVFKTEIQECLKPTQSKVDFSKFTIGKKPISVSKLLTLGDTNKHVSDWMLYSSNKSISLSELSGQEIEKFNPSNRDRNRTNTYKTIYSIIYQHLVDDNKPVTLEAWVKSILFFDIRHLYFGVYKACFEGGNFVPYTCPHCAKIFMENVPVTSMVKYKTPEIEAKVQKILQKDTTGPTLYETTLVAISETYAIGIKVPTVYNVIFENSILETEFTDKYSDILGVISYIDEIYYIDTRSMELTPINVSPDRENLGKSVKRKIKIYHEILKSLNSDQYSSLLMEMKKVNELVGNDITYIVPSIECPGCKKQIEEQPKDPLDMLFTRHQLVALANI